MPPDGEVKVARRTVVVIGILAILGGIGVQGQNIAFLVALAFAVAASANLPTILYSLFWRRFTTRGAVWSMYGGLAAAIILIVLSPVFWGTDDERVQGRRHGDLAAEQPGHRLDPARVLPRLARLGRLSRRARTRSKAAEMEVRSLTGLRRREGDAPLGRSDVMRGPGGECLHPGPRGARTAYSPRGLARGR